MWVNVWIVHMNIRKRKIWIKQKDRKKSMVLNYQNKFPYIARKVQTPPTLKQTTQTSKMWLKQKLRICKKQPKQSYDDHCIISNMYTYQQQFFFFFGRVFILPLHEISKGSNRHGCKQKPVSHKDKRVHSRVHGKHWCKVHPCIA